MPEAPCPRCGVALDTDTTPRDGHGALVCPSCPPIVVRSLALDEPLRVLLARLWEVTPATTSSRCAVRASELEAAEASLKSAIPDVVLAYAIATRVPPSALVERTRERYAHAEATWSRAIAHAPESRLVVIASWGEWPRFSVGFRPTKHRTAPPLVVWDWKSWCAVEGKGGIADVEVLARTDVRDGEDEAPVDVDSPPSAAALAAFVPVVEADPPSVERFVVHAKFGRGRVLRELGDKLEIDFGDHGCRTLLARFVTAVT